MHPGREFSRYESGSRKIDIQKQFRELNAPMLENAERSRFVYTPETDKKQVEFWRRYEAKIAHGYPGTAWLQLGLLYGCGLYTAKEQGLVRRGVIFCRFWRFHYFDWIGFAKRGATVAWAGGLLAGIIMFGSPDLTLKRCIN